MSSIQQQQFGTRAVHAGQEPDPSSGAVIPPISLSTTFAQRAAGEPYSSWDYSRSGNPSRHAFEVAVAALENGKHGLAFASGSVTTATIMGLLSAGDHVISVNDVYGGTSRYFRKVAPKAGLEVEFLDMADPNSIKPKIRDNTRLIWVETPTNPTLRLVDIKAIAEIAHSHKDIILVVDNTFLSPYFQSPLALGADIVVHSVSKFINGHSDVVMGVAVTNSDSIYKELKFLQNSIGGIPSPFDCFMANRGLKTLHLRMRAHDENGRAVAKFLEESPYVEQVIYPGLSSHPQHELAKRQTSGFGGMISFRLKDAGLEKTNAFLAALRVYTLAESLGGIESLVELPAVMTHAALTPEARMELGVTDNLIRMSNGIEDSQDLIADLKQALVAVNK
ncbi:MAG: hypothetical protein SGCHY_004267 [Lobulomycetales sp.]